jgi:hypothetical protein
MKVMPKVESEQAQETAANAAAEAFAKQYTSSPPPSRPGPRSPTTTPPQAVELPDDHGEVVGNVSRVWNAIEVPQVSIAGLDGFSAITMLLARLGHMLGESQMNLASDIKALVDKTNTIRAAEDLLRSRLADGQISQADITALRTAYRDAGLDLAPLDSLQSLLNENGAPLVHAPFSQDEKAKAIVEQVEALKSSASSLKDSCTSSLSLLQARAQKEIATDQEVKTSVSQINKKMAETSMSIIRNI